MDTYDNTHQSAPSRLRRPGFANLAAGQFHRSGSEGATLFLPYRKSLRHAINQQTLTMRKKPKQHTLLIDSLATSCSQTIPAVVAVLLLSALLWSPTYAAPGDGATQFLPAADVRKAMRSNRVPAEPKQPDNTLPEQAAKLHAEGQAMWEQKSFAKALDSFDKAARLGHAPSCIRLGDIYWKGEGGVRVDPTKASKFYEMAGRLGHAASYTRLGFIHYTGEGGVPVDHAKALQYFRTAAAMDDRCGPAYQCSLQWLGIMAREGHGQPANPQRAAEYFRREIQRELKGDGKHQSTHAVIYLLDLPIPLTRSDLRLINRHYSHDLGSSSLLKLADKMEQLAEGTKNAREAESLRMQADGFRAETVAKLEKSLASPQTSQASRRAEALYDLGRLYELGFGSAERRGQAKSLLEEAAAAGYEPARAHLEKVGGADASTDTGASAPGSGATGES